MVTLERIVESIKIQLKPHLTDDVVIHDEWLIQMINDSRAALVKSLYVSGDNLLSFYQDVLLTNEVVMLAEVFQYSTITLPFRLMEGCGRKNIQYIGKRTSNVKKETDYHYVSYEEFVAYQYHRFGGTQKVFTETGNSILIRNVANTVDLYDLRLIVEHPNEVSGYKYRETPYPIGENNLRQLEIITFQHIAPKLGMPVDLLNNGNDETKNASVKQQVQQSQPEQNQQQ